jgi:hypothetical protein
MDSIPEDFWVVDDKLTNWRYSLAPSQKMSLEMKAELVKMKIEQIKVSYQTLGEVMGSFRSRERIQSIFEKILQLNKELDKQYQDIIKAAMKSGVPVTEMPNLYKEILQFYTEQNKALNDVYKDSITNGKPLRKLHEYVAAQTEKYIKEMEETLSN